MAGLSAPISYTADSRRGLMRVDWQLLGASIALLLFGLMSLYSVGQGPVGMSFFRKQLVFFVIGLAPFSLFASVNPNSWRRGTAWLYAINIVLLVAVLVMGKHTRGAERWIPMPGGFQFQPSELAKIFIALTLSSFYADRQDRIQEVSTFLLGIAHVALPVFLLFLQPHLGAALVLLATWLAVSIVAGIPIKYVGAVFLAVAVVGASIFLVPAVRAKLPAYQLQRVEGIITSHGSNKNVRGNGWQTDRAEIALGAGGAIGSGFLHGEQKQAGFIPEQNSDFIVTVVGEEGGLIGCTLLLMTFGFFFYRIFVIMLFATEPYLRMAVAGVFAILGFHTFINIAMVLQLFPVVGLWLPFMSYGGTALWLCMACVGLLLAIRRKERPLLF